jgi:hypothetical protein
MDLVVLDECLPRKLKKLLEPHHTRTVPEVGLACFKNGKLLRELSGRCRAFIIIDSNLSYQQNLPALPFASILISAPSNRLTDLEPLSPAIVEALDHAEAGAIIRIPS